MFNSQISPQNSTHFPQVILIICTCLIIASQRTGSRKIQTQESRWKQFPLYASYRSVFATCYISDTSLFIIHFKFLPLTEVTLIVSYFQAKEWNLKISHLPSLLLDGYWVYLPLTLTGIGNHKHHYIGHISIIIDHQVPIHIIGLLFASTHCDLSHWHLFTRLSDW